jgi:hypothetical protein
MPGKRSDETTMRDKEQPAAAQPPQAAPHPREAQMSGVFHKDPVADGGWGFVLPRPDGTFDVAVATNGAVVGSGPEANIRLTGDAVAPKHATIEVRSDGVYLHDLGSAGGTYVSGVRASRIGIVHGDVVRFGRVLVVFVGHDLSTYQGRVEVDSPIVASPGSASAFLDPAIKHAKEGRSFVIEGGPGIGKRTLAQLAAKKRADRGRAVTIDAAETGPGCAISLPASGAATYIVAHADRLPRPAQAEIAHAAAGSRAIVIATLVTSLDEAICDGVFSPAFAALFGARRVCIPSLDARREDIPGIIWALGRKIGIGPDRITVDLLERFARAGWAGGITEIEAALREAAASTKGPIDGDSIRRPLSRPPTAMSSSPAHDDPALARERLTDAIGKAHGSVAAAARSLGMSRQSIYREALRLGIDLAGHRTAAKNR